MPITTKSDLKLYDEQIDAGYSEVIQDRLSVFNAASRGAIGLSMTDAIGDFEYEAFFQEVEDIVTERNPSSTNQLEGTPVGQGERVSVNVRFRTPYMQAQLDGFRRKNMSTRTLSFIMGQQLGRGLMKYYVTRAIAAFVAAVSGYEGGALVHDATDGPIEYTDLNSGIHQFGDAQSRLRALAMHSFTRRQLVEDALSNYEFDDGAGLMIASPDPQTMNRVPVITDSVSFVNEKEAATNTYYAALIAQGGITVDEADEPFVVAEIQPGRENLVAVFQAEGSFNLGLKGFAWNTSNGGAAPTASQIGSSANWNAVATSPKSLAGALIEHGGS